MNEGGMNITQIVGKYGNLKSHLGKEFMTISVGKQLRF
jgi:hypothetical protein